MEFARHPNMSPQPIPPDQGAEGFGGKPSERIQLIIEAAETAATGIIDDAEAQAERYLAESRARVDSIAGERARELSALTDDLIARAEAVKRQSDEFLRALEEAGREMQEALRLELGPELPRQQWLEPAPQQQHQHVAPPPPPAPEPQTPPPPVQQVASPPAAPFESAPPPAPPAPVEPPPAPALSNPPSEGARLLATQMAVAGSSREEVEGRLQNEFGIRDTGPMLDAIFGPGR